MTGRPLVPVTPSDSVTCPAMRFAVIGDVHDDRRRLAVVLERLTAEGPYDLVVLPGDLGRDVPFGSLRRLSRGRNDRTVAEVITVIGETLDAPVVFVPGNHDMPDPPETTGTNADGGPHGFDGDCNAWGAGGLNGRAGDTLATGPEWTSLITGTCDSSGRPLYCFMQWETQPATGYLPAP